MPSRFDKAALVLAAIGAAFTIGALLFDAGRTAVSNAVWFGVPALTCWAIGARLRRHPRPVEAVPLQEAGWLQEAAVVVVILAGMASAVAVRAAHMALTDRTWFSTQRDAWLDASLLLGGGVMAAAVVWRIIVYTRHVSPPIWTRMAYWGAGIGLLVPAFSGIGAAGFPPALEVDADVLDDGRCDDGIILYGIDEWNDSSVTIGVASRHLAIVTFGVSAQEIRFLDASGHWHEFMHTGAQVRLASGEHATIPYSLRDGAAGLDGWVEYRLTYWTEDVDGNHRPFGSTCASLPTTTR